MVAKTRTIEKMLGKDLYDFTFRWEFGDFDDPRFRPRMEALIFKFKEMSSEFSYYENRYLTKKSLLKKEKKENQILKKHLYRKEIQLKEAEDTIEELKKTFMKKKKRA